LLKSSVTEDEKPSYKEKMKANLGNSKPNSDTETPELTSKIPQKTQA